MITFSQIAEVCGFVTAIAAALALFVKPIRAKLFGLNKSGISSDPVKDMKMSEDYLRMIWGDPAAVDKVEQTDGGQGEAEIVESDNDNGENDTGGSV